jgi:transposase InsO family protein
MSRRTTIALIRAFCDAFEKYGYPRFVRTDNEAPFASSVLTLFLWAFGIRHQRIDPHCPWQNGRIERSFWTLKQNLIAWWKEAGVPEDPQPDLDLLRTWVNHVRPHQGLAGLSPAEAWDPQILRRPLRYFSAWNGLLSGYGRPV